MQALGSLALVVGVLSAEPVHARAQPGDLGVVVAKATGLGSATSRSRNGIPFGWHRAVWPSRPRIYVQHGSSISEIGHVDIASARRPQPDTRHAHAPKVVGRSVVFRHWKVWRKLGQGAH